MIDGKAVAVASDQASIVRDISAAQQAVTRPLVDVAITPDGDGWRVTLTGQKPGRPATIALSGLMRLTRRRCMEARTGVLISLRFTWCVRSRH